MKHINDTQYMAEIDCREVEIRVLNWMQQNNIKYPGERIEVKEDLILGTPAAMATIVSIEEWGYYVRIDGDDPEWIGPVGFDGERY